MGWKGGSNVLVLRLLLTPSFWACLLEGVRGEAAAPHQPVGHLCTNFS